MLKLKDFKKKVIWISVCTILPIFFILIMGINVVLVIMGTNEKTKDELTGILSKDVEQYRPIIRELLEKYKLSEYEAHILSIIQNSSAGSGTDVMMSSLFESNTRYSGSEILDSYYSIECGIVEFKFLLEKANITSPEDKDNLLTLYQAYHFNRGYLGYAVQLGGYSLDNAERYLSNSDLPIYLRASYATDVALLVDAIAQSSSGEFMYPIPTHKNVSSPFGWRVMSGKAEFHKGIDFPAPEGTPIVASMDGEVIQSDWSTGGYGFRVKVRHPNGYTTHYAHCSRLNVNVGEQVKQGDTIAFVGNTGASKGNHVHWELIAPTNELIDGMDFLNNKMEE